MNVHVVCTHLSNYDGRAGYCKKKEENTICVYESAEFTIIYDPHNEYRIINSCMSI